MTANGGRGAGAHQLWPAGREATVGDAVVLPHCLLHQSTGAVPLMLRWHSDTGSTTHTMTANGGRGAGAHQLWPAGREATVGDAVVVPRCLLHQSTGAVPLMLRWHSDTGSTTHTMTANEGRGAGAHHLWPAGHRSVVFLPAHRAPTFAAGAAALCIHATAALCSFQHIEHHAAPSAAPATSCDVVTRQRERSFYNAILQNGDKRRQARAFSRGQ